MVHLESGNIDQENKRIEIGCKGRFACVKPFCFASFLWNYLILCNTDDFLSPSNLSAPLEKEVHRHRRNSSWVLRSRKILSHPHHLFQQGRVHGGRLDCTTGGLALVLALWSLASHFSFLTFHVLWSELIQQPFIEGTLRLFSESTIMLGTMHP